MECVFECGENITWKMMKHHCQKQCTNVKIVFQEHDFIISCIAVKESDEDLD